MARPISITVYIYMVIVGIQTIWEWPWTGKQVLWFLYSEVIYWSSNFWRWCWAPSKTTQLLDVMASAKSYESWSTGAYALDRHVNYDLWRQDNTSDLYDFRLIEKRHWLFHQALKDTDNVDIHHLTNLLQTGLSRNLGSICHPRLYNRAFHGTKTLIGEYILEVVEAIETVATYPTSRDGVTDYTDDQKQSTLSNSIKTFGHSALVLQGGAMFGLCHLGVVKALFECNLLPRCIVGTATGALIAALVCVQTREELPNYLSSRNIDITAFTNRPYRKSVGISGRLATLMRRLERRWSQGHFLDIDVLEEMLKANIGDVTFNEAYKRTGMVLNIVITGNNGEPSLLNYLTAPYVLIWSAALASNATPSTTFYRPVTVLSKHYDGSTVPWSDPRMSAFRPSEQKHWKKRLEETPLNDIRKQFNVNHFIISQAQPYLAPFLRTDLHEPNVTHRGLWKISIALIQQFAQEVRLRLQQLNQLGLIPSWVARCLLDEHIPGLSLTLVPKLEQSDFLKLLDQPNHQSIDYWILKGERSVWPAIKALKTRCVIEVELQRGLEFSKRRTASQSRVSSQSDSSPLNTASGSSSKSSTARSTLASIGRSVQSRDEVLQNGVNGSTQHGIDSSTQTGTSSSAEVQTESSSEARVGISAEDSTTRNYI